MVPPGSDFTASWSSFRSHRKWRTETGAFRDSGGQGDPGAAATMGREFGKLSRVRHVITYSLSPFEQRAFPHYFSKGIPNMLRRIQASILRSAPPFVAFYLVYTWGTEEFEKSKRKNPAAYENDK
ncbi:cytochrome b-c1 complex subunit 8 [Pteropus alecto]|nr:cytochrome b-c1 complex subunit 8 [Pteropus alecto]